LRAQLPQLVERVRKGARFTVLYRSRPAFRIVPMDDAPTKLCPLEEDPIYKMKAVGRSADDRTAEDHDKVIYEQ
jgi:antitoxin (DNA-binding transcriptional repressor) of toxin-antitoxin stability system